MCLRGPLTCERDARWRTPRAPIGLKIGMHPQKNISWECTVGIYETWPGFGEHVHFVHFRTPAKTHYRAFPGGFWCWRRAFWFRPQPMTCPQHSRSFVAQARGSTAGELREIWPKYQY